MAAPCKVTNARLVAAYNALAGIKTALDDPTHRLRAASLRVQLAPLAQPVIEECADYDAKAARVFTDERIALCQRLALRDQQGRPVLFDSSYIIDPAKRPEFNEGLAALRETHKDAIAVEVKAVADKAVMLKSETEVPAPRYVLHGGWFNKSVDQDHLEALVHLGIVELPDADGAPKTAKA